MKNILAKLGSKKVMGAVLVMVTLVVGLGVVSNFNNAGQKQANEAALSKFEDNAYNNSFYGSTASRADLEMQMSAQQDKNTARFLRSKGEGIDEDEAFSSDGAYAEGVRTDEGFVYGNSGYQGGANGNGGAYAQGGAYGQAGVNGAYDPSNPMYAQGGVDENGVPYGAAGANGVNGFDENGVPYGADGYGAGARGGAYGAAGAAGGVNGQDEAAAGAEGADSAAAKAAKAKQAKERANRLRRATQINKLANAGGVSRSWGGASGGGNAGGAGSAAMGGNTRADNARRALPSTDAAQANGANSNAFKFGRGGTMGGFNVASAGGAEANGTKGRGLNAAESLVHAGIMSSKAVASQVKEGAKSQAEGAFDGSSDTSETPEIDTGAGIQAVNPVLNDPNNNPGLPKDWTPEDNTMTGFSEAEKEFSDLQKDLTSKYIEMAIMWVVSFLAIWAAIKFIPQPWGGIVAAVLTVAALVWAAMIFWGNDNGIFDIIRKMGDEKFKKFNLVTDAELEKKNWIAIGASIATVAVLGAAWYSGISSLFKRFGATFKEVGLKGGLKAVFTKNSFLVGPMPPPAI